MKDLHAISYFHEKKIIKATEICSVLIKYNLSEKYNSVAHVFT